MITFRKCMSTGKQGAPAPPDRHYINGKPVSGRLFHNDLQMMLYARPTAPAAGEVIETAYGQKVAWDFPSASPA